MMGTMDQETEFEKNLSREELILYYKEAINNLGATAYQLQKEKEESVKQQRDRCSRSQSRHERSPSSDHSRSTGRSKSPERKRKRLDSETAEELRDLKHELDRKKNDIKLLRRDVIRAKDERDEYKEQRDSAAKKAERTYKSELQSAVDEFGASKKVWRAKVAELEDKIRQQNEKFVTQEAMVTGLQNDLQESTEKKIQNSLQIGKLEKDKQALSMTHENLIKEHETLKRELEVAKSRQAKVTLDEQPTVSSTDSFSPNAESAEGWKKKENDYLEEISKLEKALALIGQTKRHSEDDFDSLTSKVATAFNEKIELNKLVTQLQADVAANKTGWDEEKKRVKRREKEIVENRAKFHAELKRLQAATGGAAVSPGQLGHQQVGARASLDMSPIEKSPGQLLDDALVADKDKTISRLRSQVSDLNKRNIEARKQLREAEQARDKWYKLVEEAQLIKAKVKDQEGKLDQLNTEVAKIRTEKFQAESALSEVSKKLAKKNEELKQAINEKNEAVSKRAEAEQEADKHKEEADSFKETVKDWCISTKKKEIVLLRKTLQKDVRASVVKETNTFKYDLNQTGRKINDVCKRFMAGIHEDKLNKNEEMERLSKEILVKDEELTRLKRENQKGYRLMIEMEKLQKDLRAENASLKQQLSNKRNSDSVGEKPDTTVDADGVGSEEKAAEATKFKRITEDLTARAMFLEGENEALRAENDGLLLKLRSPVCSTVADPSAPAPLNHSATAASAKTEAEDGANAVSYTMIRKALKDNQEHGIMLNERIRLLEMDNGNLRVQNAMLISKLDKLITANANLRQQIDKKTVSLDNNQPDNSSGQGNAPAGT